MDVKLQHMIFRPQDVICMARQEKKYSEKIMLIYDGLHYAALAISPFEGAPEEFDQTIFPVQKGRTIGPAEDLSLKLVKEQQRRLLSILKRLAMSIFRNIDDMVTL
ncbi:hypothetical protein CUMW_193920 [Citrus unshiu]|uniref:Ubiquitin thioesterase OTU n=1 Tax=Citrus unshiu TaxID=55188 RepID=A0A2H5Q3Z2_CITUN|nr:hypothetical protein CUMW_193920 [Citrus unshiu]